MKYNKGFIGVGVIIAIIVTLAVGGGVVYYATKTPAPSSNAVENNYQPQANQNSTIPPTTNTQAQNNNPSSAPVGTPSTSNLKTYTNTKYGFEFQYPSTWKECDNNTLQKAIAQNNNDKYIRVICIYDSSFILQADTDAVKSVVFYVDESGQHGILGTLRNTLQADHQRAINLGLYSTFAEKILGGRSFLHAGAGDVGTWGTYYVRYPFFRKENQLINCILA